LAFVGGEPTLHGGLFRWAAQAKSQGVDTVLVQTNARRLAYQGYARQLRSAGVDSIEASMAGPRPAIHDYHTAAVGSFTQTTAGVMAAVWAGLRVGLTLIVTRSNYRHLDEQVALAARLGVAALHFSWVQPVGSARLQPARVVPRWQACMGYLQAAATSARRHGIPLLTSGLPWCQLGAFELGFLDVCRRTLSCGESGVPEACSRCALLESCIGAGDYVAHYGTAELRPQRMQDYEHRTRARNSAAPYRDLFVGLALVEPATAAGNSSAAIADASRGGGGALLPCEGG
jgi:hypothetical protein